MWKVYREIRREEKQCINDQIAHEKEERRLIKERKHANIVTQTVEKQPDGTEKVTVTYVCKR